MKQEQLIILMCWSITLNLLANRGKGQIVNEKDSAYGFNITWTPAILKNGNNYSLYLNTDDKKLDIDRMKLCVSIKIDSLNQTFFDDCIETRCNDIKEVISSLFPSAQKTECPITTTGFNEVYPITIEDWVPLIAGNFELHFNITINSTVIKGTGYINAE